MAGSFLQRMLGTAPDAAPSILDKPTSDEIDQLLNDYRSDINRQNLVTLGRDFTPEDVRNYRHRARFNDPRYLYGMYDELMRLGPAPQLSVSTEAMKSANAQFITYPEDYNEDASLHDEADPKDVADARAARDFLEDTLSPYLTEIIEIHANEFYYGIADSKITLEPRGNAGKFDSIEHVEELPARRHRLNPLDRSWQLMLSPDSYEGVPVADLGLRDDGGTEGVFFTEIDPQAPLDQRGVLWQCLVPWGIQQYGMRWYAKYVELFGIPPRMAFVDFAHPNRVKEAQAGLKGMGSTSYGVFQTGTDVRLLEAHNGGAMNPFETILELCTRMYDATILGHQQAMGVQKGVGGKLASGVAAEAFRELTNSRLRTLSSQLTRGLGRTLISRNLGKKIAQFHPAIVRLAYVERDDPTQLATTALTLKNAGAGEKIQAEDLVRRCNLRVAEEGDVNLGPPVATGQAPAAGGATTTTDTTVADQVIDTKKSEAARALEEILGQRLGASPIKGTHVYDEIRKVITGYMEHERKRAVTYAKRRMGGK
jgi:hypothetical protein